MNKWMNISLDCFTNNFTLFDIETTGEWGHQEIIELAAIKVEDLEITDEYQALIKPKKTIKKSTIEYNNITPDMVKDKCCLEEELVNFYKFLGTDILVGHNIKTYDIRMLNDKLFDIYGISIQNDLIDTLDWAKKLHPELEHKRLENLTDYYNINVAIRHRALEDCKSNLEVYIKLWEDSNEELIDCSKINHYRDDDYSNNINIINTSIQEKKVLIDILAKQDQYQIKDKIYVVSGEYDKYPLSKNEIKIQLKNLGAKVTSSVSGKTDVLLIGDNPGPAKLKKAQDYGTKIIKADDFFNDLYSYF